MRPAGWCSASAWCGPSCSSFSRGSRAVLWRWRLVAGRITVKLPRFGGRFRGWRTVGLFASPVRSKWASDTPELSAAGWDCTTLRHKTHGTGSGDEVEVAYAWHPWAGQSVRVHEVIERTTGASGRCSLVGAPVARLQEIPVWMLDAAACRWMSASALPVAAVSALVALRSLLSEAMARATGGSLSRAAIAFSDHHYGDRHATPPPPASDAGSSTRPLPGKPCADAEPGPRMERGPARSGAARGDQVDDPPVDRTRQRRGTDARERRR